MSAFNHSFPLCTVLVELMIICLCRVMFFLFFLIRKHDFAMPARVTELFWYIVSTPSNDWTIKHPVVLQNKFILDGVLPACQKLPLTKGIGCQLRRCGDYSGNICNCKWKYVQYVSLFCIVQGSSLGQLSTGDNSPRDKNETHILPTRTTVPRTTPHQDHF